MGREKRYFWVLRYFRCCLAVAFVVQAGVVCAQDRADVVRRLMTAVRAEDFRKAVGDAQRLGFGGQALAEAKLMYGIRMADAAHLVAVMKDVERGLIGFDPRDSIGGLQSVEQYRGLMCLARAMIAMDKGDEEAFREQVNKGFWLFPEQGGIFGKLVAQQQMEARMKHLRIDFSSPLLDSLGHELTLGDLLGQEKALLLLFWSSASKGGTDGLSELLSQGPRLKHAGITLAGVNIERKNPDIAAREFQEANGIAVPWVAESGARSLARVLEVHGGPRAVLVSREGRVLFNGHPRDVGLWRGVRLLAPSFAMPVFR